MTDHDLMTSYRYFFTICLSHDLSTDMAVIYFSPLGKRVSRKNVYLNGKNFLSGKASSG